MAAEYTKAELDAMTDGATEFLRSFQLDGPRAEYARQLAAMFAVQFPAAPELPRIVIACAQGIAALGAEQVHSTVIVNILGTAGVRLQDEAEGKSGG